VLCKVTVAKVHGATDKNDSGLLWLVAYLKKFYNGDVKYKFDRKCGCSCGCSPGFRIQAIVPDALDLKWAKNVYLPSFCIAVTDKNYCEWVVPTIWVKDGYVEMISIEQPFKSVGYRLHETFDDKNAMRLITHSNSIIRDFAKRYSEVKNGT
jgi:hypothetical protein